MDDDDALQAAILENQVLIILNESETWTPCNNNSLGVEQNVSSVDATVSNASTSHNITSTTAEGSQQTSQLDPMPSTSAETADRTSSSVSSSSVFTSLETLVCYFKSHPKTAHNDFSKQLFSPMERKNLVSVCVSKMVDCYSCYPSTDVKLKAARLLADVTKLPAEVYFDKIHHKGYINSCLDNLRMKLPSTQRKYQWQKKCTNTKETVSRRHTATEPVERRLEDSSCARGLENCEICEG